MDWKKNFLESSLLGQSTDKSDSNAVQLKCIDLAYKDMMTAGRYYSKSFLRTKDEICSATDTAIKQCEYVFSKELILDTSLLFCDDTIGSESKYVTGYGLAQKLINMTFKYLYVFSDLIFTEYFVPDFSLCDCPLDSIIIKKASINGVVWSKLTDLQYQECQNKISNILKSKTLDNELSKLGNLAFDFLNW